MGGVNLAERLRVPFMVLAGAGISYAPPSSLPKAINFMEEVICALPLTSDEQSLLLKSTNPEWEEGIGFFHFLRFEQLVETLRLTVDPKLSGLLAALPERSPNQYHFILARLLKEGFPVVTTNFDCLIEAACDVLGFSCTVLFTERDFESYQKSKDKPRCTLFKIHGSVNRRGFGGLTAGISDVTTELIVAPRKWSVVAELLERHDLLVIGYSGADDFDVMPQINYAKGGRRVCWINHYMSADPTVFSGLEGEHSLLRYHNRKLAWFFDRMFLSLDHQFGRISRKADNVSVIDADTQSLLVNTMVLMGKQVDYVDTKSPRNDAIDMSSVRSLLSNRDGRAALAAGRLLQLIGRYDGANIYMHRFLKQRRHSELKARAHLWIAQMMDERLWTASAATHFSRALSGFRRLSRMDWTDIIGLANLTKHGGLDKQRVHAFLADAIALKGGKRARSNRPVDRWLLGRRGLSEIVWCVRAGLTEKARELMDCLRGAQILLDSELMADLAYWGGILESLREDQHVRGEAAFLSTCAADTYERLQLRGKWIDALIFAAEQYLPSWPDSAYSSADIASMLCRFIGSDLSGAHALRLQAWASEILTRNGEGEVDGMPVESADKLREKAEEMEKRSKARSGCSCCFPTHDSLSDLF
jgi:hypothetical protein